MQINMILKSQRLVAVFRMILIVVNCTYHMVHADEINYDYFLMARVEDDNRYESLILQEFFEAPVFQFEFQSEDEVQCLALNIYFEARGEPIRGQLAVGHVVMNRVANKHYPDTVCEVVQQGGETRLNHCQFSWWCDGRSDKPVNQTAWEVSKEIANTIYSGYSIDPTNGALWYHADYVEPYWKDSLTVAIKIGQHVFYRKKEAT